MKPKKENLISACNNMCTRRSFIGKSLCNTIGVFMLSNSFTSAFSDTLKTKKTREEIHKQLDDLVDEYMPVFGTCSQTSFYALNKTFKLKADRFVKSLASMPGIALRGETCGAVSGSLLAIAMAYEETKFDREKKRASRQPSITFCSKFEDKFVSTRCEDVVSHVSQKKYNVSRPEDYQMLAQDGVYKHCSNVVKQAVHIAADLILDKA
jgi:C_GCAxxG_C_C family probable redox protein